MSQVKIRNWIKGREEPEVVGVSARFGKVVSDHVQDIHSVPLAKLDPEDACTESIKPVCPHNSRMHGLYFQFCFLLHHLKRCMKASHAEILCRIFSEF